MLTAQFLSQKDDIFRNVIRNA